MGPKEESKSNLFKMIRSMKDVAKNVKALSRGYLEGLRRENVALRVVRLVEMRTVAMSSKALI